ncbi:hypothetical protein AAVH_26829 [Aphelenchoides avenae]|nr:hypothetical protein AAVH_26829 [Aphelenchus avenae]
MPAGPADEGQKFVYYTTESLSSITRGNYLNRYPKNFFHEVLSYISGSHVYVPYGGYGPTALPYSVSRILEPLTEESVFKDKSIEGVFWLVSNCNVASARQYAAFALEA